jgi:hypothetical protein
MNDDSYSFNSRCPTCDEKRPVTVKTEWLRTALANNLPFEVRSVICGHNWAPSAMEIDHLKNHPLLATGEMSTPRDPPNPMPPPPFPLPEPAEPEPGEDDPLPAPLPS